MKFTIVTGMSGAGKTQVMRYLEDMGFFCVDNMPPILIPKFSEMLATMEGKFSNVAFVIDTRVGKMINELLTQVNKLRDAGYDCKLLYIDANDTTLVKRYKETRRNHPVSNNEGLLASIQQEREMLTKLFGASDYVIDTSHMKSQELLRKLKSICSADVEDMDINVMAFGFKYGIPVDADLVFDVRCFPNPFYVDELKHKTGNDEEVQEYVMKSSHASEFLKKLIDMMEFMIPLYIEEGKVTLTIAIGCTGGKHRSVTIGNRLGDEIKKAHKSVNISYRDIEKE